MEGTTWEPPVNGKVRLKMKKRKSVSERSQASLSKGKPLSPLTNILPGFRPKEKHSGAKRRNPFQCDNHENKRAKIDKNEASVNDLSLFRISRDNSLKIVDDNVMKTELEISESEDRFETKSPEDRTDGVKIQNEGNAKDPINKENIKISSKVEEIPTDWTLKTKLKFRSDVSFSWCTNLKTSESARGIVDFVRCNNLENHDLNGEDRIKVEFKKNLSSWIHPNLPFIPTFPVSESVLKSNASSICKDEEIRSALMKNWSHSFQSVFTLSKCGFCPYFYFCCQSFTVLFVGSRVLDTHMRAVITPTTKGFREMLQKDGIDFEMPLFHEESSANIITDVENEINDLENDFDCDKENICKENEDEDFLHSIGLNAKNFSSIKERKIADEISRLQSIDRRPKSTIIVKGADTNALFNFLINSDVILAQSGPYQGVPPTLLAPVAFEGASLRMLKCVQGPMKFQDKGSMKQVLRQIEHWNDMAKEQKWRKFRPKHSNLEAKFDLKRSNIVGQTFEVYGLELTGPILPTQFQGICNLLKTKHTRYEATVKSHVQSSALNCLQLCEGNSNKDIGSVFSSDFGIDQVSFKHIKAKPLESNGFLTGLKLTDGEFEWKMNNA